MNRNLLKTLLLTASLVLGAGSLWADDDDESTSTTTTYFSQDYESATDVDWTTGTSGRFTPVLQTTDDNTYLTVDQNTRGYNSCTLTSSSTSGCVTAGTDFTMTLDLKLGFSNNQYPVTFTVYDAANTDVVFSLTCSGTYSTTWYINGEESTTITIPSSYNTKTTITEGIESDSYVWYSYQISRSGNLTYLTVTDEDDATVFEQQLITTVSSTGGVGKMTFFTSRYYANFAIDNVVVRSLADGDVPAVETATYTIKYVDESGNTLKDAVEATGIVDEAITLTDAQKADFTITDDDSNTQKYIYVSDDSSEKTVGSDGTTEVTITYREAATYTYAVYASIDGSEIQSGSDFEGNTVTIYYPRYLNQDGTLYEASSQNSGYFFSLTLSENTTQTIAYSATEITNVIYFSEAENIDGLTAIGTSKTASSRISCGNGGYGSATIAALPEGTYTLGLAHYANTSNSFAFTVGETEILTSTGVGYYLNVTQDFTLSESGSLAVSGGNSLYPLDFVYIVAQNYTKTLPSTLFASFSAPVSVSVPEGLYVYQASEVADDAVTLTLVDTEVIPANTGVMLYSETEGDYTLEATDETSTADFTNNCLIASSLYPTVGTDDGGYTTYYGLSSSSAKFAQITSGITLSANKAYLGTTTSQAKSLSIVFGSTNGIAEISTANSQERGALYNLQGIRVENPQKGLYIRDGKKVILK